MALYLPSKHWLMALIPLSVACIALSNNIFIRKKDHSGIHPLNQEKNRPERLVNKKREKNWQDTPIPFVKTEEESISWESEFYPRMGLPENQRFFKNSRFNIDID